MSAGKGQLIPLDAAEIKTRIFQIRDQQVMLDKDIAVIYGVKPIRLREQVQRNIERFPEDFMFQLTDSEVDFMVSQNAIPSRKHLDGNGLPSPSSRPVPWNCCRSWER
ncbi:MAG: ORF6N domain-containing protein [Planctomycetota bacterium]|jgi:hypothetical protein